VQAALRADFLRLRGLTEGRNARNIRRNLAQFLALVWHRSGKRRRHRGVVCAVSWNARWQLLHGRNRRRICDGRKGQQELRGRDSLALSPPLRMRKSRQQELLSIAALRQCSHQIQQALNRLRSLSTLYLQRAMCTQSRNVQWTLSGRQQSQNRSLAHTLPKPLLLPRLQAQLHMSLIRFFRRWRALL
jgi:hypothetical protein